MINVACVLRSGGKVGYDVSWVEKLQRAVSRNLSVPHQFVCLSDCAVPCQRIALLPGDQGFWSKVQLFRPNIFGNDLPVLYIDLDTVICGDLDTIYDKIKPYPFVMWFEKDTRIASSALMYWSGNHSYLWDLYQSQPLNYWRALYGRPPLYGDQALISENTDHVLLTDLCPEHWFSFANPKKPDQPEITPRILFFRKTKNKPNKMTNHALVTQHWI
jgi:hypothetical protein